MESLLIETDETRSETDSDWVSDWVTDNFEKLFAVWDFEARSYSPLGPTPAEKQAQPCWDQAQKRSEGHMGAHGSAEGWISFCRCTKFAGHGEGCKRAERGPAWCKIHRIHRICLEVLNHLGSNRNLCRNPFRETCHDRCKPCKTVEPGKAWKMWTCNLKDLIFF